MERNYLWFILFFFCSTTLFASNAAINTTFNTNCNGVAVPTSLFEVKFGKKHVFDVYRHPAFPKQGQGIAITVHSMPYRSEGDTLTNEQWRDGYYMGLVDRGRVGNLDRSDALQNGVYTNVHRSSSIRGAGVVIDDIRLVATALFDQDGNVVEYLCKYGVLWGLSEYGFLCVDYTSSRELGTFYFMDEINRLGVVLHYVPDYTIVTSIDVITNFFDPEEVAHSTCTGKATVVLPDDSTHYTFQWDDPLQQTTCTALNLCAGTYSVLVTDRRTGSQSTYFPITIENQMPEEDWGTITLFEGDKCVIDNVEYTEPGSYQVVISPQASNCGCETLLSFVIERIAPQQIDPIVDCTGSMVQLVAPNVMGTPRWSTGNEYVTTVNVTVESTPREYTCTIYHAPDEYGRTIAAVAKYKVSSYTDEASYDEQTICEGGSYTYQGHEYTEEGNYTNTYITDHGCTATHYLTLTVIKPALIKEPDVTICQGETYNFNGTLLTDQGIYYTPYTTTEGCVGQRELFLQVSQTPIIADGVDGKASICEGDEYVFYNNVYTQAGSYSATVQLDGPCMEIHTIDLTVNPTYHVVHSHNMLSGQEYLFNGQVLRETGSYTAYKTTQAGCDSVVVLQLQVQKGNLEIPLVVTPNGDGNNDTWQIKGIDNKYDVFIYNRFDKLLAHYKGNYTPWDGVYNGHLLPADDYWYVIIDNRNQEKYSGHVTLKR